MYMKQRTKVAILPKLHDFDGDISKQWFVYYSYRNQKTGKMVRFKTSEGICNVDKATRYRRATKLINDLTNQLKNGWNPFVDDEEIIYEDQLQYHNIAEQQKTLRGKNRTIRPIFNEWIRDKKPVVAKSTYQTYQSKFRVFLKWMDRTGKINLDVTAFTEKDAREFIRYLFENRHIGQTMVRQYLIILGQMYKVMVKRKLITVNPWEEIVIKKVEKIPARYFDDGTLAKIKKVMKDKDAQLWMAVQFQYYGFIRPGELIKLKLKDLDLDFGSITVPTDVAKSRKQRLITLPDTFRDFLRGLNLEQYPKDYYIITLEGVPGPSMVSKNYLWNHWVKIRDACNLSHDYKLYSFKHTGAVRLSKVATVKECQMQLGHTSLDMVDKYLRQMKATESVNLRERFPAI